MRILPFNKLLIFIKKMFTHAMVLMDEAREGTRDF
jgi:hypothetical protein